MLYSCPAPGPALSSALHGLRLPVSDDVTHGSVMSLWWVEQNNAHRKMEASVALCWWLLSVLLTVTAGTERPRTASPPAASPGVTPEASGPTPEASGPTPHTARFFDYADDDQIKTAEISSVIGEVSSAETRVKEAQILRIVLLGAVLAFIILILYHIFCRVFCAFGV
ncbi:uncharacterized protein LOC143785276 [Ranitomeya variabilis]|uniref:uncharacterized protein LOC143785276 n=1 Tax=Ranitomeya variabilis TaxID=490064 RepID=UPI004055B3FC